MTKTMATNVCKDDVFAFGDRHAIATGVTYYTFPDPKYHPNHDIIVPQRGGQKYWYPMIGLNFVGSNDVAVISYKLLQFVRRPSA